MFHISQIFLEQTTLKELIPNSYTFLPLFGCLLCLFLQNSHAASLRKIIEAIPVNEEDVPLLTQEDIRQSTNSSDLAEKLKWLIEHKLNFTSAPNTAIFWSGPQNREKAEKWAGESGRTTLEMTPGGQYLDGLDLFNAKQTYPKAPLAAGMPCEIWDLASSQFAKMATGTAFSFTVGTPAVSPVYCSVRTWFRVELPILLDTNNNVHEIWWMTKEVKVNGVFTKIDPFLKEKMCSPNC